MAAVISPHDDSDIKHRRRRERFRSFKGCVVKRTADDRNDAQS
jgi:hypothetical protein